jgi:carboxymethylenebutenolidase
VIEFPGALNPARPEVAGLPASGRGYLVEAAGGGPGVLVLHPWWGLNDTIKGFADRLGDAGFTVLAPDLFDGQMATTIDDAEKLAGGKESDEAAQIALEQMVLGAADWLSGRSAGRIGALGFSFGAGYALWLGKKRPDQVAGIVVYYGSYPGIEGDAPILGHFAEHDPYEGEENVAAFEAGLRETGRSAALHHYPGTKHWFAETDRPEYVADAAELAWQRTVAFLKQHLGQ